MSSSRDKIVEELLSKDRIEKMSPMTRERIYRILQEVEVKEKKGEPANSSLFRVDFEMDLGVMYATRKWLRDHGFIIESQGRQKQFTMTETGIEALEKREMVGRLHKVTTKLENAVGYEGEMAVFEDLFGVVFNFAYTKLHRHGDLTTYYRFLEAIEGSSYEQLNHDLETKIQAIKEGDLRGELADPYFTLQKPFLPTLYLDARLAKELGHYLSANHRAVLLASGEYTEHELITHNQKWVRRFMEDEMEGETESHSEQWRLLPQNTVRRERSVRADTQLSAEARRLSGREGTYRDHWPHEYDESRSPYVRDGFEEDTRWPVDQDRARIGYNARHGRRALRL